MRARSVRRWVLPMLALGAWIPGSARAGDLQARPDPRAIYGGSTVQACGWPTAVGVQGCTATLVHPRMLVTAAHCVTLQAVPTQAWLGEDFRTPARTVPIVTCQAHPDWDVTKPNQEANDIAICQLAEPIDDVPIVPILMGCETDVLQAGAAITLVGFGYSDDTLGYGPKREVVTSIQQVGPTATWLGDDVHAACHGDSGGPAYVQLADGSWRVFGATSGPSDKTMDCPQTGIYTRIDPYVGWIEQASGLDVTPCHDADGTWNPGPACADFPLAPGSGGGDWSAGCATSELSGPEATCGEPYAAGGTTGGGSGSTGGDPVPTTADGSSSGDGSGSSGSGGVDPLGTSGTAGDPDPGLGGVPVERRAAGGCSCRAGSAIGRVPLLGVLVIVAGRRRRRAPSAG